MMLSEAAESKLQAWIGPSTWHTPDEFDMNRWYDFVDQYQRDTHDYTIDETALREHIECKVEGVVDEDLRDIIRRRISLAYNILGFLKRTKR